MRSLSPYAYLSLAGQKGMLSYNFGLNLQQNSLSYKDKISNNEVNNKQASFSPNVQLMYVINPDKGHVGMLMFKRSLDDIPYDAINPNIIWTDQYNYTIGNPNLIAQKSNIAMAALSLFNNKLNLTGVYAYASNTIYYRTLQDPENPNISFTQPINLSGESLLGFVIESNQNPTNWWKLKAGGRYEFHMGNEVLGTKEYNNNIHRFYFGLDNNFTFKNNFGGTLSVLVEPTYKYYDRVYHGVYGVSGSLYKLMLNNRLNAGINFTALGNMRKLESKTDDFTIISHNKTYVQQASLSLTWYFKGGKQTNVKTTESIQNYQEIRDNK